MLLSFLPKCSILPDGVAGARFQRLELIVGIVQTQTSGANCRCWLFVLPALSFQTLIEIGSQPWAPKLWSSFHNTLALDQTSWLSFQSHLLCSTRFVVPFNPPTGNTKIWICGFLNSTLWSLVFVEKLVYENSHQTLSFICQISESLKKKKRFWNPINSLLGFLVTFKIIRLTRVYLVEWSKPMAKMYLEIILMKEFLSYNVIYGFI